MAGDLKTLLLVFTVENIRISLMYYNIATTIIPFILLNLLSIGTLTFISLFFKNNNQEFKKIKI